RGHIREALGPQLLFERAGQQLARVREDRDLTWLPAGLDQPPDLAGHQTSLALGVTRHHERDRSASSTSFASQVGLAGEVLIALDERRGGIEDLLNGAPIDRERLQPAWKAAANVLDLGVSPAVDRLLRVTYRGHVGEAGGSQQPDQLQLYAVGVLELVDQHIPKALAAPLLKLGHALQRLDDRKDQIVEVHPAGLSQPGLVGAVDRVQHFDRFELSTRGEGDVRVGGNQGAVDLQRAAPKLVCSDTSSFELEGERRAVLDEVVSLVRIERFEVGVQPGFCAAPQPSLETLDE